MASREIRRLKNKKSESVAATIEKRKETHPLLYVFSILLLLIIVVTFVGSPVASRIGGAASIVFGTYDGREIAFTQGNYFSEQRDTIAEQMRQSGQELDVATQVEYIWYQAYRQTIFHTAILIETEKAGMSISPDTVDRTLLNYPAYLENGKFSEALYNKASAAEHMQVRKLTREELLVQQFSQDVSTGMKTGDPEKSFIESMAMDERSFDFVSFPFSSYPAAELKTYAQEHIAQFRKIKASRILVKSNEGEAKEIRQKLLDKTANFEDLAKTYSKDSYATNGGDMGWRYAYDLEADFDKKEQVEDVFTLKAGEISNVIKSSLGFMIYRCDSEAVNPDLTDQTTMDTVKGYILQYERGKVEDYFMELAGKLSRRAGEIGFLSAASEAGVQILKTDYFPINLQSVFSLAPVKAIPDSATPASAAYNEEFFVRAFSLGKDTASAPIILDDQIVVLKFAGERAEPPANQTLMAQRFVPALASQSLQADLQNQLDNPAKLKDNFVNAYAQNIKNPTRSQ
jgi:peptidyl-prolyl cis-trans isomerase D